MIRYRYFYGVSNSNLLDTKNIVFHHIEGRFHLHQAYKKQLSGNFSAIFFESNFLILSLCK